MITIEKTKEEVLLKECRPGIKISQQDMKECSEDNKELVNMNKKVTMRMLVEDQRD